MKIFHFLFHPKMKFWLKNANFFTWEEDSKTTIGSNFLCDCPPHGANSLPPSACIHLSLTVPPPCGRHKWKALKSIAPLRNSQSDDCKPSFMLSIIQQSLDRPFLQILHIMHCVEFNQIVFVCKIHNFYCYLKTNWSGQHKFINAKLQRQSG